MTKIKICGIQTIEDGLCAASHGADYIGFVFAESKRQVTKEKAKMIIDALPKSVKTVGVFVNTLLADMEAIADYCGLNILQLHGQENSDRYKDSKYPIIKSVSIKPGLTGHGEIDFQGHHGADYLLFDTWHKEMAGGSGKSFEWQVLSSRTINRPYFLAGGLTAANVGHAIDLVRPFAVDVSSGVETNGVKDTMKIIAFIKRVKEVSHEL